MLTSVLLALAAATPSVPAQVHPVATAPRAVAVANVRARIIASARVTIGAIPAKGQRTAHNGLIEFE